jgi:small subunit ribosomal protein S20
MNKKQRNRKIVTQNNRNRIINRRYSSTIKTLAKLFATKVKAFVGEGTEEGQLRTQTTKVKKKLDSMIDKAVKKGVIHKNTAARKKSKVEKTFTKLYGLSKVS